MPRGPKPKGYIPLHTSVPPEIDNALDAFVEATGVAKASLVRVALANELVRLNLLPAELSIPLAVTTLSRQDTDE